MGKILLREFMQKGFSLAKLNSLETLEAMQQYCNQYLGEKIGEGSDRITFEIGDGEVIKIAKNNRAIQQNIQEYTNVQNIRKKYSQMSDMFPKVFQIDNNGRWLTCERVLPFNKEDAKAILGMQYYDLLDFVDYVENGNKTIDGERNYDFEKLIKTNKWFCNIYNYIHMTDGNYTDLGKDNFGIALRNNKPFIVILDSGVDVLQCEGKIRFINLTTENVSHEPTDYFGNYSYQEYIYENLNEGLIVSYDIEKSKEYLMKRFPNIINVRSLKFNPYKVNKSRQYAKENAFVAIDLGKTFNNYAEIVDNVKNLLGWFTGHILIQYVDNKKNYRPFNFQNYSDGFYGNTTNGEISLEDFLNENNDRIKSFSLMIEAKYGEKYYQDKDEIFYHMTERKLVNKILKNGLIPKSYGNFPERIYLSKNISDIEEMIGNYIQDEAIFQVNTKGISIYEDPRHPYAYYTYDNISPDKLKIVN